MTAGIRQLRQEILGQNNCGRTAKAVQSGQDSWTSQPRQVRLNRSDWTGREDKTTRTWWLGQGIQDRKAGIWQIDRTVRTWQWRLESWGAKVMRQAAGRGQDSWRGNVRTGQSWQDSLGRTDRAGRTGQLKQDNQDRIIVAEQSG